MKNMQLSFMVFALIFVGCSSVGYKLIIMEDTIGTPVIVMHLNIIMTIAAELYTV
jgi:lipoprotein